MSKKNKTTYELIERLALSSIDNEESELLSKEGLKEFESAKNKELCGRKLKELIKRKKECKMSKVNNNEVSVDRIGDVSMNTNGVEMVGAIKDLNTRGNVNVTQGTASSINRVDLELEVTNLTEDISLTSKMYAKDNKAKKVAILEDLESYSLDVVNAYAQKQLMELGVNEQVNLNSKEELLKILDLVNAQRFEFWAKNNQPDLNLLAKAKEHGVKDVSGSYWDVHRRVMIKRFPVSDTQISSLTDNLIALGEKPSEVKKILKTVIANSTSFEVSEIIATQNEKVTCSDGSYNFIISLQKRLGYVAMQKKPTKAVATKLIYKLQKEVVLKENNVFGSDEALEVYLTEESKTQKKYKGQILSEMISQITTERKVEYFAQEEVQCNIMQKLAMMKLV